jgi:lipopolysaccharide/colanic/teichoic acid biosynthesis glycosyltransferase
MNRAAGLGWHIISNGKCIAKIDHDRINRILTRRDKDILMVNVDNELASCHENIRTTSDGNVAGYRRIYSDSLLPSSVPSQWPCYVFIRHAIYNKLLVNDSLPHDFEEFILRIEKKSLSWDCIKIGGLVLDLNKETEMLEFINATLSGEGAISGFIDSYSYLRKRFNKMGQPSNIKFFGNVLLGKNVTIGEDVIVIGPTILSDNVKIASGSTVQSSVVGDNRSIPEGSYIKNQILLGTETNARVFCSYDTGSDQASGSSDSFRPKFYTTSNKFRTWPRLSYVRFAKRIFDVAAALLVLLLFAPALPLIAIVIKLSSPGPVFFKHRREGLYGKEFNCLKFRTMINGADSIQEKLRYNNQVDGPQFMIHNDPRVTVIGKFMRDTHIDEIPQFINILLGQMSVVGPRPSPKTENSFCPYWRNARLSVRPGITGLWQICRTRQAGRDFQEWIYYDTKYIRELSASLDLITCWKTAVKLTNNLLDHL